ncbi:hypothetical protein HK405_009581 [Cladochytrium tenue]|nr:hypothetical protein HK405_009581 [Cladochytrium tenue]
MYHRMTGLFLTGADDTILTPCVILSDSASVNAYFIFDDDWVKFVRPAEGKDAPVLVFESHPLEFAADEGRRRRLALAGSRPLAASAILSSSGLLAPPDTDTAADAPQQLLQVQSDLAMQVTSASHDVARPVSMSRAWALEATFTTGDVAAQHVREHVETRGRAIRAERRAALRAFLVGSS